MVWDVLAREEQSSPWGPASGAHCGESSVRRACGKHEEAPGPSGRKQGAGWVAGPDRKNPAHSQQGPCPGQGQELTLTLREPWGNRSAVRLRPAVSMLAGLPETPEPATQPEAPTRGSLQLRAPSRCAELCAGLWAGGGGQGGRPRETCSSQFLHLQTYRSVYML